jgi:hypothetical protein
MLPFFDRQKQELLRAPLREKLNQILALGVWCVLLLFFLGFFLLFFLLLNLWIAS